MSIVTDTRLWRRRDRLNRDPNNPGILIAKGAAESCGIVWSGLHTERQQAIPCIPCPHCGHRTHRLVARDGNPLRYRCGLCFFDKHHARKSGYVPSRDVGVPRTELLLSDYVMALRLGSHGRTMDNRRASILRRLRDLHLLKGSGSAYDAWLLALGGMLLKDKAKSPRAAYGQSGLKGPVGPVYRRLAPELVPAMVDMRIHPQAYLRRYSGG